MGFGSGTRNERQGTANTRITGILFLFCFTAFLFVSFFFVVLIIIVAGFLLWRNEHLAKLHELGVDVRAALKGTWRGGGRGGREVGEVSFEELEGDGEFLLVVHGSGGGGDCRRERKKRGRP